MKIPLVRALAWLACGGGLWLALGGCAAVAPPHGIPNFSQVAPGLWRGGQPTADGWKHLQSLGVKRAVKLNTEEESSDAAAMAPGIEIIPLPITRAEQTIGKPDRATLAAAIAAMERPGTFVHCEHGEDRTGLVVGAYRVKIQYWTKHAAYQEMKAQGFHPLLLGLYRSWQHDVP